ncbi:methionine--tRNA ligase [Leptospira selangorensis]|uniref:Methionine--tRNA ligase n=1 Tax=Leptospira selangorensis TaxID=2484982 RepID=A0A5F2BY64_9LEPT|nr:methionine--tRNA ligase [Leptospira selangorensis]TGM16338.1 methionine--tRNA ligase [Leptospira selangorensis]TGM17711.1 methionine--tRNA ligase [Leptospira selangorensis]
MSSETKRKILVTSALPYANGPIHLGHVLEAIQTDVYVRYQKSLGNECYFFCADDTHGTPIMLAARKEGISPEELIDRVRAEHYRDLSGFLVEYDNYYTTNSEENRILSEEIYLSLKGKGHIAEREIEQAYCDTDKMFLPDRFIKGTCPNCGTQDQYGDSCENCGATYSPKDLKDSHCSLCGNPPVSRNSKHIFFKLGDFESYLSNWVEKGSHVAEGVRKKLKEWFEAGLQDWDISRDGPYFGFKIPGEVEKYFYVWLDAPIGYMASSLNYFKGDRKKFDSFWKDEKTEISHFIGKDILYFHTLFWPATLEGGGYRSPTQVHVHGFITVNGEKMSKSRGTFIKAEGYLKHLDPEHLRFYLAGKLGPGMDDLDLSFDDYTAKVNSDFVGNFVNLVSRVATSILDKLDRTLGSLDADGKKILDELRSSESKIREWYETRNYTRVMKECSRLGDIANKYVNDLAPWIQIKTDAEAARKTVTVALNAARILSIYLYPVLPRSGEKVYKILGLNKKPEFSHLSSDLEKTKVSAYEMITKRVEEKSIQTMLEENTLETKSAQPATTVAAAPKTEGVLEISIEDLSKVDLRVGKIIEAGPVEGADKLVQVKLDLGPLGTKNVFAGIKASYQPQDLLGLTIVAVANLKPRKMKFGVSEAMLLASGEGESLSLFVPHRGANPGDKLK